MENSKKKATFLYALMAIALLLSAVVFTACNAASYNIKFLVDGKEYNVAQVEEGGSATLPSEPVKQGYTFKGWYTDAEFNTPFPNENIKSDITVYAKFTPVIVSLYVDGEKLKDSELNSIDAELPTKTDLTLDKWYIDSACTTRYVNQDVDNLYARFMAVLTFNNGYEDLDVVKVVPNAVAQKPDVSKIAAYYMDTEDITYVDAEGIAFDFNAPVTKNQTVTVLWKTPYLEYKENERTGNLIMTDVEITEENRAKIASFPVVSILSGITYNGEQRIVESCDYSDNLSSYFTSVQKLIFAEGIKVISGFNGYLTSKLTDIVLPDSLTIIDGAFSSFNTLSEVNLPENLEILINSFWKNDYSSAYGDIISTYDFTIDVPDSVKNIASMPTNLSFSENSLFYVSDDAIYKKDGDSVILVAYYTIENGILTVPEEINGIQAGLFNKLYDGFNERPYFDKIVIPSSFGFISYNEDIADYPEYPFTKGLMKLYDSQYADTPVGNMSADAYSIFNYLGEIDYLEIKQQFYPTDLSEYAFAYNNKAWSHKDFEDIVVFTGEVESGNQIAVTVRYENTQRFTIRKASYISESGTVVSRDEVLAAATLTDDDYIILSVTELGNEYDFTAAANRNLYFYVTYKTDKLGFTYEENADGNIEIIGFDSATALFDDETNTYIVDIPEQINGKTIVKISDGAFKDANAVSSVFIPKTVKEIGAEAFMNTSNLTSVVIVPGGLEIIGRSAFENSAFKSLALPLSNLKSVGPYAFKMQSLKEFLVAEGEEYYVYSLTVAMFDEESPMLDYYLGENISKVPELTPGMFQYVQNSDGTYAGLIKYVSSTSGKQLASSSSTDTIDINILDVQYIAVAGASSGSSTFTLGMSYRKVPGFGATKTVVRYEVMEGSVYYLGSGYANGMAVGLVTKVHKNAFTDMDSKYDTILQDMSGNNYVKVKVYKVSTADVVDSWLTTEDLKDSTVFEDGWWEGITSDNPDYDTLMAFLDYVAYDSSMLGM